MHKSCMSWCQRNLGREEIHAKHILEVGSLDVNGSLRPYIQSFGPASYTGVDIVAGKGVDLVCSSGQLLEHFEPETFDLLISTETLEHICDWRAAITDWKKLLKPDGLLVVTTRSEGFAYHGYPCDFWRFSVKDFRDIFSDFQVLCLEEDPVPGVFFKAKKPVDFCANDLGQISLYSVLDHRRERSFEWIRI